MYANLKEHIRQNMDRCRGDWAGKKNGYEAELCSALGVELNQTRYQDAAWNGYFLELKKGRSIWLDLVRYSEILVEKPELNSPKSVCLFCIPDKGQVAITSIFGVSTPKLLAKLALSEQQAKALLELRDHVPRQLNAQAGLTVSDVRSIADFCVEPAEKSLDSGLRQLRQRAKVDPAIKERVAALLLELDIKGAAL
jgi:hypothetical protein